jgi:hypothetical protein
MPIDLGIAGFPGCNMLIALDASWPILNQGNGEARIRLAMPTDPNLIGTQLFAQGVDLEPFAATLCLSQGLEIVIGAR